MNQFNKNYYVTTARFDGHGRGFVFGFYSQSAAYFFARVYLLGFAEVLSWDEFFEKYPHYFD